MLKISASLACLDERTAQPAFEAFRGHNLEKEILAGKLEKAEKLEKVGTVGPVCSRKHFLLRWRFRSFGCKKEARSNERERTRTFFSHFGRKSPRRSRRSQGGRRKRTTRTTRHCRAVHSWFQSDRRASITFLSNDSSQVFFVHQSTTYRTTTIMTMLILLLLRWLGQQWW